MIDVGKTADIEGRGQRDGQKRRSLRRFVWVLGLAVLYILAEYTIPRFPFGPYTLYGKLTAEQRAAVIPFDSLTDEQSYPFVGLTPSLNIGISPILNPKRDYTKAIARFPSVRECLVRSEKAKQAPDLRLINWDKIHNMSDADVCTWRVFSSLGTSERAREWLVFHGARNARITSLSTRVSGNWPMSHSIKVNGKWQKERRALIFPTRGWHFMRKERFRRGNGLSSLWEEHGNLESVYWKWQVIL